MKSIQVIKQVNNTELGKSGTHETYILIPQELNVSDLFEETDKEYVFRDKSSEKGYNIRLTIGREKRIVGMGPYYRENNVMAGDQIFLEKRTFDNGSVQHFITFKRAESTVYFQKVRGFFEVLTTENISEIIDKQFMTSDGKTVKVEYHGEVQKRKDSPVKTKVYNITIGETNIQANYQDRDMVGIQVCGDNVKIIGAQPWKKYVVEVKE